MRSQLRDAEHLIRLALLFAVGILLFLIARAVLVPPDFGVYGHYRAGAIDDAAARPPVFAGRQACGECHGEQAQDKAAGAHAAVGCEACHGALGAHAADPGAAAAPRPEVGALCVQCHAALVSRPAGFPQVNAKEHAEGAACNDCHDPHSPAP